jgi:hypothetical protein
MSTITGNMSATLGPLTIAPAAPPHTYFGVAQSILPGIRALAVTNPPHAIPLALLAAHALECILKAYLSRKGSDATLRASNVRHNLMKLWEMAETDGLGVPSEAPRWVKMLSGLHDKPYYLRYSEGVHGVVTPGAEPMTTELGQLLELVRAGLGNP